MSSRCLSAGGFRFLEHLGPTKELTLPYGRATGLDCISLCQTLLGVITFRTIELRLGGVPSLLRHLGVHTWFRLINHVI